MVGKPGRVARPELRMVRVTVMVSVATRDRLRGRLNGSQWVREAIEEREAREADSAREFSAQRLTLGEVKP